MSFRFGRIITTTLAYPSTANRPEFYVNHHLAHEDEARVDLVSFSTTTHLSRTPSLAKRPPISLIQAPDPTQRPSDAQFHPQTLTQVLTLAPFDAVKRTDSPFATIEHSQIYLAAAQGEVILNPQ